MSSIAFKIGPFPIHWYGIIISFAFALGMLLAFYHAAQRKINMDKFYNLVIIVIPAAIVGARLYYVLFRWEYYTANLLEIFAVRHGGLAIHGGIIGGVIAGLWYIHRSKDLKLWTCADIVAPSLILGQAIGRWGNFFNQEAHGGQVSEEFISRFPHFIQQGMLIDGSYYHPTFLYESLWNALVFLVLLWLFRRRSLGEGTVAASYLILYSIGRIFIEGLRTDSLMLGPLKAAQVVSLGAIILGIVIIYFRNRQASGLK
ncbi:MAG: prolipoprotein diacylglyceryl transferase [Peptococcaceae bacterium]|nr:prolipoprotein diacylglyceryl transferase [Peptococcaceae bacterium]